MADRKSKTNKSIRQLLSFRITNSENKKRISRIRLIRSHFPTIYRLIVISVHHDLLLRRIGKELIQREYAGVRGVAFRLDH